MRKMDNFRGGSPAHRDLLSVLRSAVGGCSPDDSPNDWPAVLSLARLHQVDHYLYPIVRNWDSSLQPDAGLMERWRNAFFGAAVHYTQVSAQLTELLASLLDAQVCVVPLKGVWLAERVYEDGACRPMCDVDLLVPPDQLGRARRVFEKLGYTTKDLYSDVERDKHLHYHRPDDVLPVELHWRLWRPGNKSVDEPDSNRMWDGLLDERLHGVPIKVFPPERQVVYLVHHILTHGLVVPLRAYLDLILLCRCDSLDRSRLDIEASAWRVAFGTKFVVRLAFDIFNEKPAKTLMSFLPDDGAFMQERGVALIAALELNGSNAVIRSDMDACREASWFRRFRLGLSQVLLPPDQIRATQPQAVHRFGVVGGYVARFFHLIHLGKPIWEKLMMHDPTLDADFENFAARQKINNWIREQK